MSRSQLTSTVEQNTGGAVSPYVAGKNAVINGGFDIWQRGTSISVAGNSVAYTADRWTYAAGVNVATTISRQLTNDTTNLPNIQYCARVQRNAGQTGTAQSPFQQTIETVNAIPYAGKTVTVSFYARAGANYSPTGNNLNLYLLSGTGTDQSRASSGFTGETYPINNQNFTLTTTWQRFTATGTVPTNSSELSIWINNTPTGTAGTNDYFEVTGVQLEIGSVATPFSRAGGTLSGELAACQRYYYRGYNASTTNTKFAGNGFIYSTTNGIYTLPNPVALRVVPTSVDFTALRAFDITGGGVFNISAVTISADSTTLTTNIIFTIAGATASRVATVDGQSSSAYLGFSAEL